MNETQIARGIGHATGNALRQQRELVEQLAARIQMLEGRMRELEQLLNVRDAPNDAQTDALARH